jgi:hypothetical protein
MKIQRKAGFFCTVVDGIRNPPQHFRHAIPFRGPGYVRDPDDSHVLDTAVAASCPHLLTFNKSDVHRASALNVTLLTPREFLAQVSHDPN